MTWDNAKDVVRSPQMVMLALGLIAAKALDS